MAVTIDLSIFGAGTFTIEDDGTPGNGTSVIRGPGGNIVSTITHPADSLTITSTSSQIIRVAFVDSLTTANVTIGSLTNAALNPGSIQIGSLQTTGMVTLAAVGSITEFGTDAATDIFAATLLLDAGTGIGTPGNFIETQISNLEAESVSGGINVANSLNLAIGGITSELRGLFTGTSGDINLVNQGSITLFDQTGLESVNSAGNATLTAIGATANITSNVNLDSFFIAGSLTLTAGQDVLFGTGGDSFDNDVRAGGNINITAGRDFTIDGFADLAADDLGLSSGGGVNISVGRNIAVDNATGIDASVGVSGSGGGSVVLTTGIGGTLILDATSTSALFAGNGGVFVNADRILIGSTSGINATSGGMVSLATRSAGRGILLGTATDGVTALELSDAELDRIFSQNLTIGSASAGNLIVSGAVTSTVANLTLRAGSDVTVNANVSSSANIALISTENVTQASGTTISTANLAVIVDEPDFDPAGGTTSFLGTVTVAGNRSIGGNGDNDILAGTGGNDSILGLSGNDVLDGGAGNDIMNGGSGDDVYVVDSNGDVVVEGAGRGNDRVLALVSYALGAGVEVELLAAQNQAGTTALNLTGNDLASTIIGNDGVNSLDGRGSNDVIFGNGGNDILDGGAGNDFLLGGLGDDTFVIETAGDGVSENVGEGSDRVLAMVSYTLTAGAEIELLSAQNQAGTSALDLTGNDLASTIIGNDGVNTLDGRGSNDTLHGLGGNDTLDGGAGNDLLIGGAGDDIYLVDAAGDAVVEDVGGGNDRVLVLANYTLAAGAEVELLSAANQNGAGALNLTGNDFNSTVIGNEGVNTLDGRGGSDSIFALGGADLIDGGLGNDFLVGGAGADTFRFSTAFGGNVDTISDFVAVDDTIGLDDAVFTGLAVGALNANAFVIGTAAQDADDRIIYNGATGALLFDADGNGAGAAVQFATLSGAPTINAGDFVVI